MNDTLHRMSRVVSLFHSLGGAARSFRRGAPTASAPGLAPAEAEIVRLCSTSSTGMRLGDLVGESPLDEEDTLLVLRSLVERGVVERA